MRTILIFSFLFLSINIFAQNGWIRQFSGNGYILDAYFPESNTGYMAGSVSILKTSNGGNNWFNIAPDTTVSYNYISFINQNTGFVSEASSSQLYSPVRIYKTTNSGLNWILIPTLQTSYGITGVFAINENLFYITTGYTIYSPIDGTPTHFGNVLKTSNGGLSYQSYNYGNPDKGFYLTQFINENTGWSSIIHDSISSNTLLKTTTGGQNWFPSDPGLKSISKLQFVDENVGYLIGFRSSGGAVLLKTTNGGTNWFQIETHDSINNGAKTLYFINSNTGWVCGRNFSISKTTNGGISWVYNRIYPPLYGNINLVKFNNELTGWIKGDNSSQTVVYRTTNGGLSYISTNNNVVSDKFSLLQNYPNPFNPLTRINYELPITNYVSLVVYDALGNEIETLVNQNQNAGSYSVDFNASSLPSGIYFYKLVTENFSETKKMILIK